jgi:lipopolysaccharide cholinephosphotransferase
LIQLSAKHIQKIETDMLSFIASILDAHSIPWYVLYGTALGTVRHGGSIPWDTDIDIGIPYLFLDSAIQKLQESLPKRYSVLTYRNDPKYVLLFPRVAITGYRYSHLHIDIFPIIGAGEDAHEQSLQVKQLDRLMHQFEIKKHIRVYAKSPLRRAVKKIIQEIQQLLLFRSALSIIREFERICKKFPFDEASSVHVVCPCYGVKNIIPKHWLGNGARMLYENVEVSAPEKYELYLKHYYDEYLALPSTEEQKKGLHKTLEMPQSIWELVSLFARKD